MTPGSYAARLVKSPWDGQLSELLSVARQDLLLACPFITRSAASWIAGRLSEEKRIRNLHITCLTNIRPESVLAGSLELEGLAELGRRSDHFRLFHMPSLHAKVFVADDKFAIVTSGNLTDSGIRRNCEYGVALQDSSLVREIRNDFEAYCQLAAQVSIEDALDLAVDLSRLRPLFRASEKRVMAEAGAVFRNRLRQANDRILQLRARGTSNQAIFCNTILYLLSTGPLKTVELHPLVQRLHPDVCDDSIDRVIDGFHFGKKWKHHVRTAQQYLKRTNRITFDGIRWHLVVR